MQPSLELRDVRKSYGDFAAVQGVSLATAPGTICGLLGPNGAGKTTTIRMIMDIIAPDRGEVRFFGHPRRPEDLRRVGYLPEERGLYRKMTVLDHLVFLGELHDLPRRVALERSQGWLVKMELAEWARKKVEELSKGMQQKIQLASTLLHEPEIVILDEPFSGLDPLNQELFKEAFAALRREGKTLLFSTHVMEQAEKLCDQICLISHGRAILAGELAEIKRELGGNSYRLIGEGDVARLRTIAGVERVVERASPGVAGSGVPLKVFLAPGVEGAEVLRQIVSFFKVREFRSEEPDLEEIFISAVRDAN